MRCATTLRNTALSRRKGSSISVATNAALPQVVVALGRELLAHIAELSERISALDERIKEIAKVNEIARQLMTIPGIGPIIAVAMVAMAPPVSTFSKAVILQHGSG